MNNNEILCIFKRVQSKTKIGLWPNWCNVTLIGWGEGALIKINFDRIFKFNQRPHHNWGMSQQMISGGIMRTAVGTKSRKLWKSKNIGKIQEKSTQIWKCVSTLRNLFFFLDSCPILWAVASYLNAVSLSLSLGKPLPIFPTLPSLR